MSITRRLLTFFSSLAKLTRATLEDGTTTIEYISETLAVGDTVDVIDADGNASLLADGSYKTDNGLSFTITEGVVSEVTQPATPAADEVEETTAETTTETQPAAPVQQSKSAALKSHVLKFAVGTPEERIANLETMVAALMEYAFGWQIKEKDRSSTENEAIDIYINNIKDATETAIAPVADDVAAMKKQFAKQNSEMARFSKLLQILAEQPANGKTFGAVGFNKKADDEQEENVSKHDSVSAISAALAKSKKNL